MADSPIRHLIITVESGKPLQVNVQGFNLYEAAEILYRAQAQVVEHMEDAVVVGWER